MLTRKEAGYEDTLGSIDTLAIVGGEDKDEFIPQVNCTFHATTEKPRGEAFLNINHIDSLKTARTDTVKDGVISHRTGIHNHEFMTLVGTDRLKWDIVYNSVAEVPATQRFKITHSPGLSFYKQVLTAEQIAGGARYNVPEVEGSYAVYMNKRDNKYETGKVCHIYSPFYICEATGEKSPLLKMTLVDEIDGSKTLTLSHTRDVDDWLNDPRRTGKIRLDPILGYDTKGASNGSLGNFYFHTTANQSSVAGVVATLGCYMLASVTVNVGIYACAQTSPFDPEGLALVSGSTFSATAGARSTGTPDEGPGIIAATTYYRVGIHAGGNNIYFDTAASYDFNGAVGGNMGPPWPDPMLATSSNITTAKVSVWVEYAEATGQDVLMGGGLLNSSVLNGGGFGNQGGFGL